VLRHNLLLHDNNRGKNKGEGYTRFEKNAMVSDLIEGKYVVQKRTAEDRREWQRLLKAGSHNLLLSRLLT